MELLIPFSCGLARFTVLDRGGPGLDIFETVENIIYLKWGGDRDQDKRSRCSDSLRARRFGVRVLEVAKNVVFFAPIHIGPEAHPVSRTLGNKALPRV